MSRVPSIHSRFGDLSRPEAIRMGECQAISTNSFHEDGCLRIHLTVTGRCYARCEGCINSKITFGCLDHRDTVVTFKETHPERDTALIQRLADRHPGRIITLCFYGGEPFLAPAKMVKVWKLQRIMILFRERSIPALIFQLMKL